MSSSRQLASQLNNMLRRGQPQHNNSLTDKIHRYSGVILIITITLMLISFTYFRMPSGRHNRVFASSRKLSTNIGLQMDLSLNMYAVIIDAGSSGSRVHVFCFDQNLDLVHIGKELEVFEKLKPGMSSYAANPKEAAASLLPLLEKAENVVPQDMHPNTPVKVGATAGLRQLGVDTSERILQAVKDFLKIKSSLKSNDEWVTVLDGTQEGAYMWVTINYLLKNLGKKYSETVGVIDLGGGSVQMAYAISPADVTYAPNTGNTHIIKEMYLMGTKYYLYVQSYLNYGLLAARAEILRVAKNSDNPCILAGYNGFRSLDPHKIQPAKISTLLIAASGRNRHGVYTYGGIDYNVSAHNSGSSMYKCRKEALKALKLDQSSCKYMKCNLSGGGDGKKNLFVTSFFFDRAAEAGFVDASKPGAKVRPLDFHVAAQRACQTRFEVAKSTYPDVNADDLPYICMDLVYQYTLLVDGFDLKPLQHITLAQQVEYQNSLVEAAWPLGSAIEAVSGAATTVTTATDN